MSSMEREIITEPDALDAVVPEWWSLWNRANAATVFQSPAWLLPWWSVFRPGELYVVAVRLRDGLAPLWLETGTLGARLLPMGVGISDYCDVLTDPEHGDEACEALSDAIAAIPRWEVCKLADLPPRACALGLPAPSGSRAELKEGNIAPVLPIPRTADSLSRIIPSTQNRNYRRACAAAERRGTVELEAADGSNAPEFLADVIRLHTTCWNSRGMPGVFADPRVARFHSMAIAGLEAEGLVRLLRLSIGGTVAAGYYGFFDHRRAYAYLQGYDPQFADESPGAVIVGKAIEAALHDGADEFHFLRGDERYKFGWGALRQTNTVRAFSR